MRLSEILNGALKIKETKVCGQKIFIKELSAAQVGDYQMRCYSDKGDMKDAPDTLKMALLVSLALCDEQGNRTDLGAEREIAECVPFAALNDLASEITDLCDLLGKRSKK